MKNRRQLPILAAVTLLTAVLATTELRAELSLGVLPDEPAPTVAGVLANLDVDGESIAVRSYATVDAMLGDMRAGRLDLAVLAEPVTPVSGVSVLANLFPSVLHVLHRESIHPDSLSELITSGKIYAGAPGGIGSGLIRSLVEDYGIDEANVHVLDDAWTEEPDVYFVFGGLLATDARRRLGGYRLWSVDDPDKLMRGSAAEGLMLRYPNLRPFILPADLYPALGRQAALTVSVSTLLVAGTGLDEDRAFEVVATVTQASPLIAAAYPLAGLPQIAMAGTEARTLPLHPGARRYLDRNEPAFIERYAEVLALAFTLVIAAGSASLAVERRRRQARKDRLDNYYQQILGVRPLADANAQERRAANLAIRAIQAEVFDLVVADRIEADGALVAFLTLSNQALAETKGDAEA